VTGVVTGKVLLDELVVRRQGGGAARVRFKAMQGRFGLD
jgi:hypothetical protein